MSSVLTRDQLMATSQRSYCTVEVPGIGDVRMQSLNDLEQSDISASTINRDGKWEPSRVPEMRRMVAAKSLVDTDGNRLFLDSELDEIGTMSPAIVRAVYAKYLELSDGGIAAEVKQQKKD